MRAVLSGYYGKGNGGDEALLASLLQMLPPHVEPIVLSADPQFTEAMYGVKSCDRSHLPSIYRAMGQADAFIWGGGSLIQDVTSTLSPYYYLGLMLLAQLMGLKTIAWGQGIGPIRNPITNWIARRIFAQCTAVSVRDRRSQIWLGKIPHQIAPDPVWALAASAPSLNLKRPNIAVTLRSHPLLSDKLLSRLQQALAVCQATSNAQIILIPFQSSQDLAIAQSLHQAIPSQILSSSNPKELKGIFQNIDMAIGMRLHSLIMAAASGSRCFALSYDPKIDQLMHQLGIPGWRLEHIPDDPQEIARAWLQHYKTDQSLELESITTIQQAALAHGAILQDALKINA